MARFRKRPVVIDAVRWSGENWSEIVAFLDEDAADVMHDPDSHSLLVGTLEGRMRCKTGDWLIRGVMGELYPCDPEVFERTYEPGGAALDPVPVMDGSQVQGTR